jgi:predicted ATPase/DNA-binding CsgD family transcriptional regulator/transcriptional regulator with XRE-family HTH domain
MGMAVEASFTFGQLLRGYREAAGLTQEELAERAGMSGRGIADLERGARTAPYPQTVRRVADGLNLREHERTALLTARRSALRRSRHIRPTTLKQAFATGTLPEALTSFIGRERDIAEVGRLLRCTRCVTLVGPGGVGKTRLAIEAVRGLAAKYRSNVCMVDLAPLAQPDLAVQATARALGLRVELDRQPHSALIRFLTGRELLLLLDNCEHLLDACAEVVVPLLASCPGVHVLATSREPLCIEGETLWRLGPLNDADAVSLFVDRARAQSPDFDVRDTAVIGQVCRRLDGLPLAIELAASRIGLLDPTEILPRLEDRFALLKRRTARGTAPRHQTLRTTVDWSYELLDSTEQQLFRRLAVFAGRFDLAGANAMGGPDTLDVLGRLVGKSLIVAEATQRGTRYRLLETLRSYAWDRLRECDEVDLARQRHLDHFLGQAESLVTPTESVDGPTQNLDEDVDNLRNALEFSLIANPQAGLCLIAATGNVWWRRSCAEGRRWVHAFLDCCQESSIARAQALHMAGRFEMLASPNRAIGLLSEARKLTADLGDHATGAMVDVALGFAIFQVNGATTQAIAHIERGASTFEAMNDVVARARALNFLGLVYLTEPGRRDDARVLLERNRDLGERFHDRWITGSADFGLGLFWRRTGQPARAMHHYRSAVQALHNLQEAPRLSEVLIDMARLLFATQAARAARLAGAGLSLAEHAGVHFPARKIAAMDRLRNELGARLGDDEVGRLWAEGERLSMNEAVALALDPTHPPESIPGGLSARELEIARLVSTGLTSRQAAETLRLSHRTVESHLGRVFTKTGVSNRLQLNAWLLRNALTTVN